MSSVKPFPSSGGERNDLDFDALAQVLSVLANANRLRLLAQLRQPRTASEIRLTPETVHTGENPERSMSRQAVHHHLEKLLDIGAVTAKPSKRAPTPGDEYVVNHQQIFAIGEEFRKLGALRPVGDAGWGLRTQALADVRRAKSQAGPNLVLVRGLGEGTLFPLVSQSPDVNAGWTVGRRADAPVCLDYDPYVSSENSRITRIPGQGYCIEDLPGSRNGTFVNWRPVGPGERVPLEHGDIVGVGKTLLVFHSK